MAAPTVAVVGARSCTDYGAHVARTLARELAAGVTVVSGLARGIDAEAHRGALDANGRTVAVLGCGIDRDYPRAHAELARRITETGGIVSEYEPGVEPAPWRFPARNRIIAALADAVVIVEARERSGALITVDLAMEIGRPIYAVPGEITSALSAGTNQLLRHGHATLITSADDVLDDLAVKELVPMTTKLTDTDATVNELTVEDWRYQQLVKAGWPEAQALVLAANHNVDLHLACDLLAKGCDLATALKIVLSASCRQTHRRQFSSSSDRRARSPRSERATPLGSSRSSSASVRSASSRRTYSSTASDSDKSTRPKKRTRQIKLINVGGASWLFRPSPSLRVLEPQPVCGVLARRQP